MKTLAEIKDEVAYYHDYKNWAEVDGDFGRNDYFMIDEVAKRYAEEALREAAKKATMIINRKGKILSTKYIAWIANDGDHSEIDKSSILNIIKELK